MMLRAGEIVLGALRDAAALKSVLCSFFLTPAVRLWPFTEALELF